MQQLIPVLFDVPEHFVKVETFVASARATERAVHAISSELFGSSLTIEVVVVAPETGSLRQILKVTVRVAKVTGITLGAAWTVVFSAIQALETDIGKAVVEEFTGKEPSEIAREFAHSVANNTDVSVVNSDDPFIESNQIAEVCDLLGDLVAQMSAVALALPRDDLEKLSLPPDLKFELSDSQAEIFEACLSDDLVKSVTFESSGVPTIPRNEFPERSIRPARPEKTEDPDGEWLTSFENVVVTSPNFAEEEQQSRKWKGRTHDGRALLFTIEDKQFWVKSHKRELQFTENTILTVQMATLIKNKRIKDIKVVRVLKIDDLEIGKPLDKNALSAILGSLAKDSGDQRQGTLF